MNCKSNHLKDCSPLSHLDIETLNVSQNHLGEDEDFYSIIISLKNLQKIYIDDNCFDDPNILEENIQKFINKKNKKVLEESKSSDNSNNQQNKIFDHESI